MLKRDRMDVMTGDTNILKLTVRQMGQLANGLMMPPIGADPGQDKGYKHRKLLKWSRPARPA